MLGALATCCWTTALLDGKPHCLACCAVGGGNTRADYLHYVPIPLPHVLQLPVNWQRFKGTQLSLRGVCVCVCVLRADVVHVVSINVSIFENNCSSQAVSCLCTGAPGLLFVCTDVRRRMSSTLPNWSQLKYSRQNNKTCNIRVDVIAHAALASYGTPRTILLRAGLNVEYHH